MSCSYPGSDQINVKESRFQDSRLLQIVSADVLDQLQKGKRAGLQFLFTHILKDKFNKLC